jgi:hypothetical protein
MSAPSTLLNIPPEAVASFKAVKRRAITWKVYRIDEASFSLIEDHAGSPSGTPNAKAIADLVRVLPPADGRYFIFDLPTKNSYGGSGSKLIFFTWAPTSAGRANVIYAAQRRALDAVFTGVIDAHVTCRDDVEAALKADDGKKGGAQDEWDPDN